MNTPLRKTGKTEAKGQKAGNCFGLAQNTGDTEMFLKEIHNRADTITPVLKQILENCPLSRQGAGK